MSTLSQSEYRKRGPRFKVSPEQAAQLKTEYDRNQSTVEEIARKMGVTKQTIYNVLKRLRAGSMVSAKESGDAL